MEGQRLLACTTGIFAEPSCSATVAALKKLAASRQLQHHEQIALMITGHGLKDIDTPLKTITIPPAIEPDLIHLPA
jgi:threonine synthase